MATSRVTMVTSRVTRNQRPLTKGEKRKSYSRQWKLSQLTSTVFRPLLISSLLKFRDTTPKLGRVTNFQPPRYPCILPNRAFFYKSMGFESTLIQSCVEVQEVTYQVTKAVAYAQLLKPRDRNIL